MTASYVLSYGQPLAQNCISHSETLTKRLLSKNAHRPNYCSLVAICYPFSALTLLVGRQEGHPLSDSLEFIGAI